MSTTDMAAEPGGTVIWPAFRATRTLAGIFVTLSVANLIGIYLLSRYLPALINPTVWTRSAFVLLSAVLTMMYTARASRGSARAYSRLRLLSAIALLAVVVIVAVPGLLPEWMKVEQAVCGLLLLGVVVGINGTKIRSLYTA